MLALFGSTITFNGQYQQRRDIAALLDLLVLDRDNPRSLGWVLQTLRGRLTKLASSTQGDLAGLTHDLPDPDSWLLADLCGDPAEGNAQRYQPTTALLEQCRAAALSLSDNLSRRYFSHADAGSQSLGA
jgi:uncharacterized alpha-E superfamily protein